ncbi:MAG: hypothetical protein J6S83_09275 [Lachnospiraceae bacterium]|nr:hypothetical protein [Lachnospiraceae bacterium]
MLLYLEDILLFLSIAGCAVLVLFMIKKLYALIEYCTHGGPHVITKTDLGKRSAKKENGSSPEKKREGAVHAAGNDG